MTTALEVIAPDKTIVDTTHACRGGSGTIVKPVTAGTYRVVLTSTNDHAIDPGDVRITPSQDRTGQVLTVGMSSPAQELLTHQREIWTMHVAAPKKVQLTVSSGVGCFKVELVAPQGEPTTAYGCGLLAPTVITTDATASGTYRVIVTNTSAETSAAGNITVYP